MRLTSLLEIPDAAPEGLDQVVDFAGATRHGRRPPSPPRTTPGRSGGAARGCDGKKLPWRSFGIASSTSPALVVNNFGRVPLRWFVRLSVRSCGPAPIDLGRFRVDERLQDHLHTRADQIDIATRAERVEELGQVKLCEGHRVISFCMFFGRNTQRFTRWPTSPVDLRTYTTPRDTWLRSPFR